MKSKENEIEIARKELIILYLGIKLFYVMELKFSVFKLYHILKSL